MKQQDNILENAIARLIGSTRRPTRKMNLLKVAQEIRIAESLLGSRKKLAERIGLSEEMIREFASVENLAQEVKEMIKKGLLTSVDVAYRISMLDVSEQSHIAAEYLKGNLTSKDIKDIVSFRKRNPKSSIRKAIERVTSSRSIIRYVVEFPVDKDTPTSQTLLGRFGKLIGEKHIVSLTQRGGIGILVIDKDGQERLMEQARKSGLSRRQLVSCVRYIFTYD